MFYAQNCSRVIFLTNMMSASGLVKLILKVTHIATIHPNAIFCVLKLSYVWWWSDIIFGATNSSIKILVIACRIDLLKNIMSGLAWLILGLIVKRFWHHRHHEMSWMLRASSGETISSVRWRSPGSIPTFHRQNCYPHPQWKYHQQLFYSKGHYLVIYHYS